MVSAAPSATGGADEHGGPGRRFKDGVDAFVLQRRAFHVTSCCNRLRYRLGLSGGYFQRRGLESQKRGQTWRFCTNRDPSVPCGPAASLKSFLHPTRMTGIPGPQIDRTSSIHFTVTFSSESGVSMANAMRMM